LSFLTSKLAGFSARTWAIVAAAVVVVLVAGTAGGYYAYAEAQPTIVTLNLKSGVTEVPTDKPLMITLSRTATLDAVKTAFHLDPVIDGELHSGGAASGARTASGARSANTFTWTPSHPWADLTRYAVRLDSMKDAGGHQVKPARWTFTTTIVPKVMSLATDTGTTLADAAEVPVNANLKVAFNTTMDQAATKILVNSQPIQLAWETDGRSATLSLKGIRPSAVEFSLAPGGHDTGGRPILAAWKLTANIVFKINIHTIPLTRPALIQIPNDPAARDQSGLQAADVVYEYATEGGITRMTAIFTNAPDVIGPVRSGRLISFALTRHYSGMLFLSGLSAGSFARINADPVPSFFDTQGYFYRSRDRFAPNNLYINGPSVQRALDPSGHFPGVIKNGPVPITSGDGGASFTVPEHNSSYAVDAATGTYTKTEDGHLMGDAAVGQPLRIRLVVVMHTTATTTSYVEDVNGVHGLDFNMESGGRADFYYDGFHAAGRWSSPNRSTPFKFELDSGQVVNLPAGLTFVDVVRG